MKPISKISVFLLAMFVLSSCGYFKSTEDKLADAADLLAEDKYGAAVIVIKGVLDSEPDNAAARYLLGKTYFLLGDNEGAEKELEIAFRKGGRDIKELPYLWLSSLREAGNVVALEEKLATSEISGKLSDLQRKNFEAWILLRKGNAGEAKALFNAVLGENAADVDALYGLAWASVAENNDVAVLEYLKSLFDASSSVNVPAALLYAEVLFKLNRGSEAEEKLRQALATESQDLFTLRNLNIRIGLIRILLEKNNFEEASVLIEKTYKLAPNHGLVAYFQGFNLYRKQNYAQAKQILTTVINSVPDHKPTLLLLGSINYIEENYAQAGFYLERYLQDQPDNLQARKMLGAAQLKLNEPGAALQSLKPVMGSGDADVLKIAGAASLAMGKQDAGIDYFKSVVQSNPDDVDVRVELAKAYIMAGDDVNAKRELEKTLKAGKTSEQAFLLLLNMHLKAGNKDLATDLAKSEVDRHKGGAFYRNAYGQMLVQQNNLSEAKKQFVKATEDDAEFWPAKLNLAKTRVLENDIAGALKTYRALLDDKLNPQIATEYAGFLLKQNDEKHLIEFLESLPIETEYLRLSSFLLTLYNKSNNKDAYARYLTKLEESKAGRVLALKIKGRDILREGDTAQATSLYKKVVDNEPDSPSAYFDLARAQSAGGDNSKAKDTLKKALTLNPNFVPAIAALSSLYAEDGNAKAAGDLIDQFIAKNPNAAVGYEMKGDHFVRNNRTAEAIAMFRKAQQFDPRRLPLGIKLARAYGKQGDVKSAINTLNQLRDVVDASSQFDVELERVRVFGVGGNIAQLREEVQKTATRYQRDPAKLNDLAWVMHEFEVISALKLAEDAWRQLPDNAAVNDTYGWILYKSGKFPQAIEKLKKAYELAPKSPEIAYHYGVVLHETGQKDAAKKILSALNAPGVNFPGKDSLNKYLR
ncbi:MAG: PEP-CTERM system TPR-repeat protein PrsT [Gammaproteobacteria bacterium]|nr:PEP-CTERM system TPR-repeat protein PrsT [Gammaproteobacteria bacterium]